MVAASQSSFAELLCFLFPQGFVLRVDLLLESCLLQSKFVLHLFSLVRALLVDKLLLTAFVLGLVFDPFHLYLILLQEHLMLSRA